MNREAITLNGAHSRNKTEWVVTIDETNIRRSGKSSKKVVQFKQENKACLPRNSSLVSWPALGTRSNHASKCQPRLIWFFWIKPRIRIDHTCKSEDLIQEESPLEFFNRDIEWLEFNVRVFNEALDTRTPLLERVRFLSICNSNLDEFFMKRVFALKHRVASGVMKQSGGLTPIQQLAAIRAKIQPMLVHRQKSSIKRISKRRKKPSAEWKKI